MGDIEEIISLNKNLIYGIVSDYPYYKDKEDLFQVGCIGLIEAYKNFNPERGCKFTSYAYPYIFGEINKYVKNDHNIKLSKQMSSLKTKIIKAKIYMTQILMHEPSISELANYLEISEDVVESILDYKDSLSMDEVIADDLSLYEVIGGKDYDLDSLVQLKTIFENLEEPERTIMYKRYYEDLTQTEISNLIGISQVDVSRREKKVLTKIRKNFV